MKRFELTINPNYVSHWGVWEALRELIQNTKDREIENPDRYTQLPTQYKPSDLTLTMGNHNTILARKTLLLGVSDKEDKKYIGKFGEGYKLALVVLSRNGIRVEISNKKELWKPKIIKSRRYNSELLVVDIYSNPEPRAHLLITLTGVKRKWYKELVENHLYAISYPENVLCTDVGNVLLDPQYKGKIYVNGLFVTCLNNEKCFHGYDMAPGHIELDRDRKKVDTFNLFWEVGRIYACLKRERAAMVHELISKEALDVKHLEHHINKSTEYYHDLCELSYQEFLERHGKNCISVKSKEEADYIKEKYNNLVPVIMPEIKHEYISHSPTFIKTGRQRVLKNQPTPFSIIKKVINRNKKHIKGEAKKIIENEILEPSRNWEIRQQI